MDFQEFGTENKKTMLLLPGTALSWQSNFKNVVDKWSQKYHLICVNYDGFEGDKSKIFTDVPTVTAKIEDYLLQNHHGRVDGAYGSSLGGSFVGLLVQRRRVHIDHAFIGSSDLDQGSPLVARLMTALIRPMLSGACTSEKKRQKLKRKLTKKASVGDNIGAMAFADAWIDGLANLNPKTITRQFYSDYVTPLANDIAVEGTTFHVIYVLKMGKKYGARYRLHFHNPDIHAFDMKHEIWLFDEVWKPKVLAVIDQCMDG